MVWFPAGTRDFVFSKSLRPAPVQWLWGWSTFLGEKTAGAWSWIHPSVVDVEDVCSCTSALPFAFQLYLLLLLYLYFMCASAVRLSRQMETSVMLFRWLLFTFWSGWSQTSSMKVPCPEMEVESVWSLHGHVNWWMWSVFPSPCLLVVSLPFVCASYILFVHVCILVLLHAVYP